MGCIITDVVFVFHHIHLRGDDLRNGIRIDTAKDADVTFPLAGSYSARAFCISDCHCLSLRGLHPAAIYCLFPLRGNGMGFGVE